MSDLDVPDGVLGAVPPTPALALVGVGDVPPLPEPPAAPWTRQPGETRAEFRCFRTWLRAGFPPLETLALEHGTRQDGSYLGEVWRPSSLHSLFRKFTWDARADAYRAQQKGADRGAIEGKHETELLDQCLRLCQRSLAHHLENGSLVDPAKIPRMLSELIRAKRLIEGESTETVQHSYDLKNVPLDELLKKRSEILDLQKRYA